MAALLHLKKTTPARRFLFLRFTCLGAGLVCAPRETTLRSWKAASKPPGFYPDRIVGGHCRYRDSCRAFAARLIQGQSPGLIGAVQKQPPAIRVRLGNVPGGFPQVSILPDTGFNKLLNVVRLPSTVHCSVL